MSNPTQTPAPLTDAPADQVLTLEGGKHPCACSDGCPGLTRSTFAQGHDARLVTRLRNAVKAGEITPPDALAELQRRGGLDGLYFKLERAIENAAKPRRKGSRKAEPIETFEVDGFQLRARPESTEAEVLAKVGRWTYEGTVRTHRIQEEGATKSDTVLIFEYTSRGSNPRLCETTRWTRVAPADDLPAPVSLRGDASAEAAREEVAELAADEDTSDIPF